MSEQYGFTQLQMLEESRRYIEAEGICLRQVYEDEVLYTHCERVARLAVALGAMYRLDMHTLILLGAGGYLHDLGKSQIAKQIMDKPSRLSDSEHQLIQAHPTMGYRMLQQYHFPKEVADMVLYHHEKLDGSGYPTGCRDIPLTVQLITVADVYEAICAKRCYHDRRTHEEALRMMKDERGLNMTAVRLLERIAARRTRSTEITMHIEAPIRLRDFLMTFQADKLVCIRGSGFVEGAYMAEEWMALDNTDHRMVSGEVQIKFGLAGDVVAANSRYRDACFTEDEEISYIELRIKE